MDEDRTTGAPDERDWASAMRALKTRRELKAARQEAASWREEALAHRRRLGIPTNTMTRRHARRALDELKAPDPASGSESQEDTQNG